ncbi:hypothetical protein OQI_33850 [Streptomyces pharetrae CZA14]|uniref:Uncharacterized protein n=1 Tax=Streptomyces pharetrae CZA14 TaxID=1144883 RepID=A0ABX3Y9H9_9ACTN|nr:hypothetical protein OQI_33850 [Streptomyces pharetrae CZA14]
MTASSHPHAVPAPIPLHSMQAQPELASVQAAAAVIKAEMRADESRTAEDLAQAEQNAGLLFDAAHVEAVRTAAYAQAQAENAAELTQAQADREAYEWFHARQRAVAQLCEGRHPQHMLAVAEVLAALDGQQPTGAPMALTWDRLVWGPSGDTPNENTLVPCTTARGGAAALVLDDEQRLQLGGLLLATLHSAERCTTPGCGMSADDLDASDPSVAGWICLEVAGAEGGARWWCTPLCANAALAAARAELTDSAADAPDDDQAAGGEL